MYLRLFTVIFLLISTSLLYGQTSDVKLTVGMPYRVVDAPYKDYFLDHGEVMSVKRVKDLIIIQKFDAKLKFIQQREYKDLPGDAHIQHIGKHGREYYIFYSLWDRANKEEQLFSRRINFSKGTLERENARLIATGDKISGGFDFHYSIDSSKLLIKYRLKPEKVNDSKSYDVIGFHVFDPAMNKLWSKEVTMPYTEKKMNNEDYAIDGEGNSYILATVFNDETTDIKKSRKGDPNYHIELLRVKANTSQIEKQVISLKDKFINDIAIFETSQDYMVCAGFYNNGKSLTNANGIFAFKVKKEGEVYDVYHHEIPTEVLNQYASKKTKRKNAKDDDPEYKRLYFDFVSVGKDGSILLVGEQFYVVSNYYTSANGHSYTTHSYHYNDILVTKLNPEGRLAWIKKIPKQQVGADLGSMSYKHFSQGNDDYFVFLDTERNENLTPDRKPEIIGNGGTGQLVAFKIDNKSGRMERVTLLNTKDVKGMAIYQLKPTRIIQSGEEEFIIEAYKKKKEDVLIRVQLD